MLTKIPEWSDSTLATEVERIEKVTKCTYLDDLIMGVFISYMKSFASLHHRDSNKEVEIDFDRPSLALFVHALYIHSARKLWQTAYLLNTDVPAETHARNRQEIEKSIGVCLDQVIREFLPWKAITKKYFANEKPTPSLELPVEESSDEEETKNVTFESDESDDDHPKLKISDEDAVLEIPELKEEVVDPMAELEKKASETLVLNL
jgi:hypothetical protein